MTEKNADVKEGEENSLFRHCSSMDLSKVCVCVYVRVCVNVFVRLAEDSRK